MHCLRYDLQAVLDVAEPRTSAWGVSFKRDLRSAAALHAWKITSDANQTVSK